MKILTLENPICDETTPRKPKQRFAIVFTTC